MPSLRDNFDELMERVRSGRELGHASFEPIYYLIFHPKEILDVKRSLPAWIAKLRNDGWDVEQFSCHMIFIFPAMVTIAYLAILIGDYLVWIEVMY